MKVFLSHPPEGLAYYGERPRAELARVAEVVRNPTGRVLEPDELAEAAAGCAVIVADRQTTAPASLFERSPDLVAFVRGAVDIRTVDVEAASRAGVLVTRASSAAASPTTPRRTGPGSRRRRKWAGSSRNRRSASSATG